MNINDLPIDILSKIFGYLHPHEWFFAELVCKHWSAILRGFWDHVKEVEYESYGYTRIKLQDGCSYQLTCSGQPWTDENDLLKVILKRCGSNLHKLTLQIPQEMWVSLKPETILYVGDACKELKSLNLNGHISPMAEHITVMCQNLLNLEELYIWDESFPDETRNDVTAGVMIDDIVSTCAQLRSLEVTFWFILPPSEETCRRLPSLRNLEKIRWLFWSPLSPDYVENFFASIVECRRTLRDLSFSCKLKAPLNGGRCGEYLKQLADGDDRLEILDLGFQLQLAQREDYSNEIYYEPTESAPWTSEVLSALRSFQNITNLSLRYFELDNDAALELLKHVCENLQVFRLEDNYGVNGKLTWTLRSSLKKLRAISISQAWLSHADVVEFILACPNLETMRFSNIESMSFKRLVLETHASLHHCGSAFYVQKSRPLNLRLDTARGFIHDEAEDLKRVHLCGLTLEPPSHSNVIIDRVCKRLDA